MHLGIEIGGTKLQIGVGDGKSSRLEAWERFDIQPQRGAAGILEQIENSSASWKQRYSLNGVGVGFGGPVDTAAGRTVKSHQIEGWEGIALGRWCEELFEAPAALVNDCDAAALAEALYGAGRTCRSVFYVTVGTGVGGGFVLDGRLHGEGRPAASEIGHLRPGLHAERPEETVESLASGWGLAAAASQRLQGEATRPLQLDSRQKQQVEQEYREDLLSRSQGDENQLTAKILAQAAEEGNEIALQVIHNGTQALGWAIAQVITLLAPEKVVVGGGVSLMGEALFLQPLRRHTAHYVFPPLAGSCSIESAELGELVVVCGAIASSRQTTRA